MEDKVTQYHDETPQEVKDILERYRNSDMRIRLFLGDGKTGEEVFRDGKAQASFDNESKAGKYIQFMMGERNN